MKYLTVIALALLLVASVAATGVLIKTESKAAGYNDVAYYAYHEGNTEQAETLYRLAIDEDARYERARYNLATLLFEQGRYVEAAEQLEYLLTLDGENVAYHYDLAVNIIEEIRQNLRWLDRFDEAIAHYEKADRLSPGYAHVKENLEVLYHLRNG